MSRHDVSWKKRNAVARASRGSLRCLAVGTKRKPLVAKLAGQPLGLGNEVALLVETDKHRCLPGPELLAIGGRSIKAKGDRRHAPGDKLAVLGWPISQRDIRFTLATGLGVWAASPTTARVSPSMGQGIDPHHMMMNASVLPATDFADYTFVFR